MNNELNNYLELMFLHCNLKKYHKYFNEWLNNLTPIQLEGFNKQRVSILNKKGKYEF